MNSQAALVGMAVNSLLQTARSFFSAATLPAPTPPAQRFQIEDRWYSLSVASSRAEREEAYRLVFAVYEAQGFTDPNDATRIWYSIHNALPGTVTFLVRDDAGQPVASGTVVPDSPFGLPLERMYGDEIAALRRAGRRMCEINSLVSSAGGDGWRSRSIILKVFSAAFTYAHDILHADDLVCVTSPEHARFYRRVLLLDEVGPFRADPHANGAASVALRQDLVSAEARFIAKYAGRQDSRNLFQFFRPSPAEVSEFVTWLLASLRPITEADFCRFFAGSANLLHDLSPAQLECLRDAYPDFSLWQKPVEEEPSAAIEACCAV